MFGPRHLATSYRHWRNSLVRGAIRKNYFSSGLMKSYCANVAMVSGRQFETYMVEQLRSLFGLRVEGGLKIGPGAYFECSEDLGDIDIMMIEQQRKTIYLGECKHIAAGRTPTEMGAEIDRLILDKPGEPSRMTVHAKRVRWVQDNLRDFCRKLGIEETGWKIASCFITSEEIPAGLLRELPIPVLSLAKIRRQKLDAFYEI